jgi:hypothetical protein
MGTIIPSPEEEPVRCLQGPASLLLFPTLLCVS